MSSIPTARLRAQRLATPRETRPEDVVAWFGAVQAQEYGPARWALAQRLRGVVRDREIAEALDAGRLLRTHVLRPTWHFVTPADLRWMVALTGPHVKRSAGAADRRLEIDAPLLRRVRAIVTDALQGHCHRTRLELAAALADEGIEASGQRLAHLMIHLELDAVVCSGPRRGKQFTYALMDERAPAMPPLDRDEAWRELALRFFRSHGPATLRDFTWWSGLRMAETRRMLEALGAASREEEGLRYWWIESSSRTAAIASPAVWLRPVYDEYTVAYRDRVVVPHGAPSVVDGVPRGVVFQHALVIDGQIAGTWSPAPAAKGVAVHVLPRRTLTPAEQDALHAAAERYGTFVEAPVHLHVLSAPRGTIRPR